MTNRRSSKLLLILLGLALLILGVILIVRLEQPPHRSPFLLLRYGASSEGTAPPRVLLSNEDKSITVLVLIPHRELLQAAYNISVITPLARHIPVPSMRQSRPGSAGYDSLQIDVTRDYFPVTPGSYTLMLNELFISSTPSDLQPAIYLFPFTVTAQ